MPQRRVHAIQIVMTTMPHLLVVIWPDQQNANLCCRLVGPSKTWATVKAADAILVRDPDGKLWTKYKIKAVKLYRVFPVEFNGEVVLSAQERVESLP